MNSERRRTYSSILEAIGNTPLVEIRRLNPNPRVKILAKLEYCNPGGSIKDRAALAMIEAGERSGLLTADKTVIEATSGNTGIGLALVCSVKGYRLLLAMAESVSIERKKILKARGAEILLTPGHLGTDGAIEEVYRLVRESPDAYFMADQYNTEANWEAHYYGTAPEIWEQTGGRVTAVVVTMGTTGTLMGLSRRLKEYNPAVAIIGVEPYLGHKLQGLKNLKESYCPEIFDKKRLDRKVNVEDEEAFEMTRRLARHEGLFLGMSSGAAMAVACREAEAMEEGVIVVICPDGGERYLSTSLFTVAEEISLHVFNTLTRTKEPFRPLRSGRASVYTCGPTAYERMRIADCRRFIFADLLCRHLEFRGHQVFHVMNITDLDDRTIEGSQRAGMELSEFTNLHVDQIIEDLNYLRIRPADETPRASAHVDDMISLAQRVEKQGAGYEKLRSLYFDISQSPEYGKLSGVDLEKIKIGATVNLDEYEKDNPRDFTLFKRCTLTELKRGIYAKTDWGNVRPSWHIQCAAMAMKYLGESFDIHTGGRQHIFPHHENEIAISLAATGKPLARYWMHCDRIEVDGEPGGPPLTELAEQGYSGREVRFWLLTAHYRKPLRFSTDRLDDARRSLQRLDACIHSLQNVRDGRHYEDIDQLLYDLKQGFTDALDDDLNASAAMAAVFRIVRKVNRLLLEEHLDPAGARKILEAFREIDAVWNVCDFTGAYDDDAVRKMMAERDEARKHGDWKRADQIRDRLKKMGVVVRDRRAGANKEVK
ncbi:MAG: cysteine--tRNA ligase [Desulfobacterales bacterium]|nr:cysteine--tRNA ligase [Desulfobacterales bacterium]